VPQLIPQAGSGTGLTTGQAPFIEEARQRGEMYIRQPYELYSEQNHEAWRKLYARLTPRWERYANWRFLEGLRTLGLDSQSIPQLGEVNKILQPRTGFQARPVSGYVPAFIFFDCLRRREFPTTVTIRRPDQLDYLPEPDIFHDIAGHVPMHTGKQFAGALVRFGDCAHTAAHLVSAIRDPQTRVLCLTSIIKAMARFFWFTVEFGLMRERGELKAYGSGLLSSFGELAHSIEAPEVQRYPIRLEWAVNQGFEIDHYQPLLFIVESFDHLYSLVDQLESWMRAGRLNNVAPGEPQVNERDLKSFLEAELTA
jgi:phenylalanine-4-hydroxylase